MQTKISSDKKIYQTFFTDSAEEEPDCRSSSFTSTVNLQTWVITLLRHADLF
jgi:hypothetical protein